MKNARPGSEDRLLAAETAGRRAGEADAIKKGLFVHPAEKIQTPLGKVKVVTVPTSPLQSRLFLPRGGGGARQRRTVCTRLPRPRAWLGNERGPGSQVSTPTVTLARLLVSFASVFSSAK